MDELGGGPDGDGVPPSRRGPTERPRDDRGRRVRVRGERRADDVSGRGEGDPRGELALGPRTDDGRREVSDRRGVSPTLRSISLGGSRHRRRHVAGRALPPPAQGVPLARGRGVRRVRRRPRGPRHPHRRSQRRPRRHRRREPLDQAPRRSRHRHAPHRDCRRSLPVRRHPRPLRRRARRGDGHQGQEQGQETPHLLHPSGPRRLAAPPTSPLAPTSLSAVCCPWRSLRDDPG
mmetsp:Transcript_11419/g.36234  ORF Transcript_11419/g.36234 Transcript_11419/m.36234 type:complete len:233 (+) Transcript_11419:304-1002(+)